MRSMQYPRRENDMKAQTAINNDIMTVSVDGEINTITTPELAKSVEDLSGIKHLIFDLDKVPYVSSAGLRLFLSCQRTMLACGGEMLIKNCNYLMAEIFESVGYDRIMHIEKKEGPDETNA